MFKITDSKGFHITFANGWAMSVQFGPGNYCDHHDAWAGPGSISEKAIRCGGRGSSTAEIAVISPDGEMVRITPHDTVQGWVTPDEVARIMSVVATDPASIIVAREEV